MEKIDFVVTWVDGSDPEWQKEYQKHLGDKQINFAHYRDYGTLRYWFRAVENYAPWVNQIHFVTCGQIPEWLNSDHPKIRCVSHSDYMPADYLPTFSANPIELNFHRIEGLAEQFVYFNDDTFLTAPVTPEDFFKNGLPCDAALLSSLIPSAKNEVITYILFNDLLLINSHFSKKSALRGNMKKWLSPKYGKAVLRNLYYLPLGKFSGFVNPHLPNSFLKSTFEEVWQAEGEYLDGVSRNKFRTKEDVNQYLMRYWQLAKGQFTPRTAGVGCCTVLGEDDEKLKHDLLGKNYKMMCINDDPNRSEPITGFETLAAVLESVFPAKSSFEK